MKREIILALAMAGLSTSASAAELSWHFGGGVGSSMLDDVEDPTPEDV